MARRCFLLSAALTLLVVVGCQSASPRGIAYPPPNLAGPVIQPAPAAPVVAAAPAPGPRVAPTRPPATPSVPREWVPTARGRNWQWIVIHHSATDTGSARAFDSQHRQKGWDELGYHFVVGNGSGSRDGLVEVGSRWPVQKWGAHAKTPDNRFNEQGIGICLVGNFDLQRPTARQVESVSRLVAFLMDRYNIPPQRVIGHRDTGKATDCPGANLNVAEIRRRAGQVLASTRAGAALDATADARGE